MFWGRADSAHRSLRVRRDLHGQHVSGGREILSGAAQVLRERARRRRGAGGRGRRRNPVRITRPTGPPGPAWRVWRCCSPAPPPPPRPPGCRRRSARCCRRTTTRPRPLVLYSETRLNAEPNGRLKRVDRRVYRILRSEGAERGTVFVPFTPRSRITDLHAWCIPATGKGYEVRNRDAYETALGDAAERRLVGVAVPDLVALARGGDAPGVQVGDAAAGREWHEHGAALGTLAAQDPVDAPVHALEPAVGLGIQPRLAVEHRWPRSCRRAPAAPHSPAPASRRAGRRRRGRRAAAPRTPGRARRSGRA